MQYSLRGMCAFAGIFEWAMSSAHWALFIISLFSSVEFVWKEKNWTDSRLSPVDKIIPIPMSILSFEKGWFVDSLNVKYLIRRQQNTNYITKISDFPIAIRTLKITVDWLPD